MHYLQQMVDYIQQKYIDTSLNDYDSLINLIDLNFKHLIVFDWFDFDDWRIDSCIRAWITSLIHSFAHVTPISALKGTTNAMANHFHVVNVQGVVNRIRLSIAKVLWYTGAAWEATNWLVVNGVSLCGFWKPVWKQGSKWVKWDMLQKLSEMQVLTYSP